VAQSGPKNLPVSHSPKKPGYFQTQKKGAYSRVVRMPSASR
jgi:hypothetical protein